MKGDAGECDVALSRIDSMRIQGREFFVKRDDLIDPLLSGNKYRKLYRLVQTECGQYQSIVSYGGTQSNAMLSIAAICHRKGWRFHYTSRPVPERFKHHPTGNLKMALELGMQLHEVAHDEYEAAILALQSQRDASTLLIPQGGADPMAQQGITVLAQEISQWRQQNKVETLYVVTPSGTGTTAFYLAMALPAATVLTTPAVGDCDYLQAQMRRLGAVPANLKMLQSDKKYHFAKPCPELLASYQMLHSAGIEFDLIYGALMWRTLLQHMDRFDGTILYVHSGGLLGNDTMLARYRHQGMI